MVSNLKSITQYVIIGAIPLFFATSCANHGFKVKGEISDAQEKSIILEKSDFQGRWLPVDSTKINKDGGFSLSFPAPLAPEIYRLSLNGQYVYLPVDSTETITVNSSYNKFGAEFTLKGSQNATQLEKFEKELHATNTKDSVALAEFKRGVYTKYMKDAPGSILSFYILTKTVDGKPLYNPEDAIDSKYFGAVATGFKSKHPDDPHTAILEQTALQALKKKNSEAGKFKTLEAQEIALIDIDLQDDNGKQRKLSDIAGKGKPVVVIFSQLTLPEAPQFNIALSEIYKKHPNIEFYHVSIDPDQYAWRDAAKNLPWITVYSPGQDSSEDAVRYNVFQIPSFYIYDGNGELKSRPMTLEELNKSL